MFESKSEMLNLNKNVSEFVNLSKMFNQITDSLIALIACKFVDLKSKSDKQDHR